MNWSLFWLFCTLNVLNVVVQTIRYIVTIKCNKWVAAISNAVAYGWYTVVLVYMTCDLDLWLKVIVVAMANFIGVFTVKACEERTKRDKLWKVEATVETHHADALQAMLNDNHIAYSILSVIGTRSDKKYVVFNIYCPTSTDSRAVRDLLKTVNAKYFVGESKTL